MATNPMTPAPQPQQPQQAFDVAAARRDGVSDDDILQHLGRTRTNFDLTGALRDGQPKAAIIDYLAQMPPTFRETSGGKQAIGPSEPQMGGSGFENYTPQWPTVETARALPYVGGAIGAAVGNAPGAAIGGAAGELANQAIRAKFGQSEVAATPGQAALQVGEQGAIQGGATALGGLASAQISKLVSAKLVARKLFDEVSAAAGNTTVDVGAAGDAALRARELQEVGQTMPRVLQRFLTRVTSPGSQPLAFDEARDFASSASRLSADENMRITPAMKRQVAMFAGEMRKTTQAAADSVGPEIGQKFSQAMSLYKLGATASDMAHSVSDYIVKEGPAKILQGAGMGAGGSAVWYTLQKILGGNK